MGDGRTAFAASGRGSRAYRGRFPLPAGAGRSQELLEKIADIEIMLDQMHVVFGDDAIAIAASPKIERLCGRLAIDYQKRGER